MKPGGSVELEHMGLPFSRLDDGRILINVRLAVSPKNFGGGQAARTAAMTVPVTHCCTRFISRTEKPHPPFSRWYVLDLVKNRDGAVVGLYRTVHRNR